MDRELMKTMREDQMDMMMMMQIDKIPKTSHPFTGVGELPTIDFSCGTAPPVFDTLPLANQPSPLPFISPLGEEPITPSIFSNGMVGRSRNTGELSGAIASFEPGQKRSSVAAMREMIFRIAAMQPIHIDPESVKPPKRRNVKISKDPQSVAARHRRERISERIRILQRLVPGGTKMDTASMLDEAIHYVKFLKTQVQSLERAAANGNMALGFPSGISNVNFSAIAKAYHNSQIFSSAQLHS